MRSERRKKKIIIKKWFRVISYKLVMSSEINVIVQSFFFQRHGARSGSRLQTLSAFGGSQAAEEEELK